MYKLRSLLFGISFYSTTPLFTLIVLPGLLVPYRGLIFIKQIWLRLVLAGVVLMTAGLVVVAILGGQPPTSEYQPPQYVDGKIKPAESIPK